MILFRIAYMIRPAIVLAPIFVFIFWRIVSIVLVLRKTSFEISSVDPDAPELEGGPAPGMSPEELKEHLRRLNPEDLGRFNP